MFLLARKKAKSVVVKGKKAGKATLTAKIKVGKKTYKKTCKITVKKASKVNVTPVPAKTDAAKATATPETTITTMVEAQQLLHQNLQKLL